jgi:hypothetical protein
VPLGVTPTRSNVQSRALVIVKVASRLSGVCCRIQSNQFGDVHGEYLAKDFEIEKLFVQASAGASLTQVIVGNTLDTSHVNGASLREMAASAVEILHNFSAILARKVANIRSVPK